MHPRWTGGVVPPVAAAAAAPRLCLRIGGEDLRDDPVQIVKEGRPLPQDEVRMFLAKPQFSLDHELVVETLITF